MKTNSNTCVFIGHIKKEKKATKRAFLKSFVENAGIVWVEGKK